MSTNVLTIDLTNSTSVQQFEGIALDFSFKPITSAAELDAEINFGSAMDRVNETVSAFGEKLLYWDIARVVHLVHELAKGNQQVVAAFNAKCSAMNISAPKDATANPYGQHVALLMSRLTAAGSYMLAPKWKNLLRVVRWLVENKVRPQDVPDTIAKATATDSTGTSLTRLQALNELDKQAHKPGKSKAPSRFGSPDAEKAIRNYAPVAQVTMPNGLKFNAEGFGLAVVRKGANGEVEVLFDACLQDKFIMSAVREGYKAVK